MIWKRRSGKFAATVKKKSEVEALLELPAAERQLIISRLLPHERLALSQQIDWLAENPWVKFQGDPIGFVENGLGENLWSKQKEILDSLLTNKRTAVPACHAPGKTHIAARAIAYWASVYPPGTSKIIVTASNNNQVKNVMWPHVRRIQELHKLPGYTNSEQWRMGIEPVAMAIKPPDDDESGIHGHHAPNMLIVVDESGGVHNTFGRSLEALMTGANTRLLLLGNPPTDEENTWFERCCSNPLYNVIPISAFDTPNFTGEFSGICRSCPPSEAEHEVATHLIDHHYAEIDIESQYGKDSPMYQAKVLAQFPRDNTAKTLPISWLETAHKNVLEPGYEGRIKLGCDIASDGGDEFAIAELDGWRAKLVYSNAGAGNEDAVQVAGKILEYIRIAERKHADRGITEPVRVKIDAIGVGWGVTSMLQNWGKEGKHHADIVGVNVAEKARESEKFMNQRAEMWWSMRALIQPTLDTEPLLWLDCDHKELAQLNAPTYSTNSTGRIQIEKKIDMKKRGIHSPDRAEAFLLAIFEPPGGKKPMAPIVVTQSNPWASLGSTY